MALSRKRRRELVRLTAFSFIVLGLLYVFAGSGGRREEIASGATNERLPHQMHGRLQPRSADGNPLWTPGPHPGLLGNREQELLEHGFFRRLSDAIDLNRNVTDIRDKACQRVHYDLAALPQTSVIFVFHNEAMSTLLRSIHSVLNRTPPELLLEIILVDDGSTKPHLGAPLEEYISKLPKTRLVRLPERSGLVKARLRGAQEARAETFTILDSHIEVQPQWLEPLMERISHGRNHVMMPIIDSIDAHTFQYEPEGIGCTLGFLWVLTEHGIDTQDQDEAIRTSETDVIRSPTMAGGLFSINREFFWEIGGYDEEFGFWGTENLEFSFRIWQCGGTLECSPCSRVGHVFRSGGSGYSLPPGTLTKNKLRTAEIWMDEFAFLAKDALGNPSLDIGPLDKMRQLRESLHCKPFSWFLQNVYPEAMVTSLDEIVGYGRVEHLSTHLCLDTGEDGPRDGALVELVPCEGSGATPVVRQQHFMVHHYNGIRPIADLELCVMPNLRFATCEWQEGDIAAWHYNSDSQLRHVTDQRCMVVIEDELSLDDCVVGNNEQIWRLQPLHEGARVVPDALEDLD
eukprot:m.201611 g.201611  ORF g.201611 m.201611 type:complete len:572 (-) comp10682_c0_seq1:1324-3039(-)